MQGGGEYTKKKTAQKQATISTALNFQSVSLLTELG